MSWGDGMSGSTTNLPAWIRASTESSRYGIVVLVTYVMVQYLMKPHDHDARNVLYTFSVKSTSIYQISLPRIKITVTLL